MKFIAVLGALFFGSFLLYGLASGRMPARFTFYDRAGHPRYYWASGALWAAAIVFCIYQIAKTF